MEDREEGKEDKARMATAPTSPSAAQGACPEGTQHQVPTPGGYPIPYQISKECGWFPGTSTPQDKETYPSFFL